MRHVLYTSARDCLGARCEQFARTCSRRERTPTRAQPKSRLVGPTRPFLSTSISPPASPHRQPSRPARQSSPFRPVSPILASSSPPTSSQCRLSTVHRRAPFMRCVSASFAARPLPRRSRADTRPPVDRRFQDLPENVQRACVVAGLEPVVCDLTDFEVANKRTNQHYLGRVARVNRTLNVSRTSTLPSLPLAVVLTLPARATLQAIAIPLLFERVMLTTSSAEERSWTAWSRPTGSGPNGARP